MSFRLAFAFVSIAALLVDPTDAVSQDMLTNRYAQAFSGGYTEVFGAEQAIADITTVEKLTPARPVTISVYRIEGDDPRRFGLKVFSDAVPLSLSYRVPVIENHGLRVVNERTYQIVPGNRPEPVWLHDMRLQVICRENEADAWEAADQLVRHATERQKQEMKTLYNRSEANQRVQQLARDYGDLLMPHLWTGITKVRPGAGIAVVGDPAQCAATLQQFIDAGCHSFCLSGYLHDEEAERFGRLIRPTLAANNRGRLVA